MMDDAPILAALARFEGLPQHARSALRYLELPASAPQGDAE
jgi:hypothetical protein